MYVIIFINIKQTEKGDGLFILINLIKGALKILPFTKLLMPGTGESDESVIDSGSSPTRFTVSVFEHVTPLLPHRTF